MNYENRLLDFVRRTRQNLDVTESWRKKYPDDGFHEVTHLINSLLGLVVLPTVNVLEKILHDMDQAPVEPTGIPEWGVGFSLRGEAPPKDLYGLVSGLRNAVAHYDLQYMTDEAANITGVIFEVRPWGRRGKPLQPPWDATFTVSQLRAFLKSLTDEVEKAYERSTRAGHAV